MNAIAYHEAVRTQMGEKAASFQRLYLLPGVYHCGGGEGPSVVDFLTPLMNWVEHDAAPEAVVARAPAPGHARTSFGQPPSVAGARPPMGMPKEPETVKQRSRPLFPYPAVARYAGKGNPDAAASYVEGKPLTAGTTSEWLGADFFRPYDALRQ